MQGDVVANAVEIVDIRDDFRPGGEELGIFFAQEGIETDDIHAERGAVVGDDATDRPQTDDADRLTFELGTDELGFAFLDEFRDFVAVADERFFPLDAADNGARRDEHREQNELGDGIGVCAGRIENDDAVSGALGKRNIVYACARASDAFQRFEGVVIEFVHIGRTQNDGVGVGELRVDGVLSRVKVDEPNGGNLVHGVNFKHDLFLFIKYYSKTIGVTNKKRGMNGVIRPNASIPRGRINRRDFLLRISS